MAHSDQIQDRGNADKAGDQRTGHQDGHYGERTLPVPSVEPGGSQARESAAGSSFHNGYASHRGAAATAQLLIHPNVLGRFHPLRNLSAEWTLENFNRTPEAQLTYQLLDASSAAVAVTWQPPRSDHQNWADVLVRQQLTRCCRNFKASNPVAFFSCSFQTLINTAMQTQYCMPSSDPPTAHQVALWSSIPASADFSSGS